LRLLAEFQLQVDGRPMALPHSVERVVAFLGMHRGPVARTRLAATLWPDVADQRANGDLRSALWRLRRFTGVIEVTDNRLALAKDVEIDVAELSGLTQALIAGPTRPALDRLPDLVDAEDILPGWDEEWLIAERERYRIQRLRALESSAVALLAAGDHVAALDAAMASVATEPYRESAHRLAIRIHLAEGNHAEAIRAYRGFRSLVADELGITPSSLMEDLVAPLGGPPVGRRVDDSVTLAR
jgi:DNA-binding SARP family transcriptional activator